MECTVFADEAGQAVCTTYFQKITLAQLVAMRSVNEEREGGRRMSLIFERNSISWPIHSIKIIEALLFNGKDLQLTQNKTPAQRLIDL